MQLSLSLPWYCRRGSPSPFHFYIKHRLAYIPIINLQALYHHLLANYTLPYFFYIFYIFFIYFNKWFRLSAYIFGRSIKSMMHHGLFQAVLISCGPLQWCVGRLLHCFLASRWSRWLSQPFCFLSSCEPFLRCPVDRSLLGLNSRKTYRSMSTVFWR